MDYIDGKPLGSYLEDHKNDAEACERIAKNSLALLKSLTKLRIIQGDTKMTNILVLNGTPYLIDFDGALEFYSTFTLQLAFKKELNRFMRNWENTPDLHALFGRLMQDEML